MRSSEGALQSSNGTKTWLSRLQGSWLVLLLLVLASLALARTSSLAWLCDDAFVSFRYADNWARGVGLVFNANERVEGITNPLWTLILAVLARLGLNVETAATTLGLGAHLLCILLLAWAGRTRIGGLSRARYLLPIGAIIAVADTDLSTFATGGLETSLFSTAVLASLVTAWLPKSTLAAGACAGLCVAVSGMLRPDGILFLAPLALAFWGRRRRGLVSYLVVSVALLGAFHGWRRVYFGSFIPNTYYAKSAFVSWWTQGAIYLGYFSIRHVALLAAAVAISAIALVRMSGSLRTASASSKGYPAACSTCDAAIRLIVPWAMTLVYCVGVVRVGGDFMYARLLVPIIPLLAYVVDLSVTEVWGGRPIVHGMMGLLIAGATLAAPCPVDTDIAAHYGVVDERAYYQLGYAAAVERTAGMLRNCIDGFATRAAIYGGELRLAYRARIPYAVEAHAGLTDAVIAHRPLAERQRIGHEKSADASYLVLTKKVHFATSPLYAALSDPHGFIPEVHANLCGVDVRLLHWDPAFVRYVRARGADVPEFTVWLDRLLAHVDTMSDASVLAQWQAVQHFYFAHNADPQRLAVFEARLQRSKLGSTFASE
jgi:arabinofuranosyltransferase